MRWKTGVWMSAAFLVATSALHLTIEQDLLAGEKLTHSIRTTPASTRLTSGTNEFVVSAETEGVETDSNYISTKRLPETALTEQPEHVAKSAERLSSNENDNVKVEQSPVGDSNGGNAGTMSNLETRETGDNSEGGGNAGAEGGDNEDEGNEPGEGGDSGNSEGGSNVGGDDEDNEDGSDVGGGGGDNDGNEGGANGGDNDDAEGGANGEGGGGNGDNETGGNGGGNGDNGSGGNGGDTGENDSGGIGGDNGNEAGGGNDGDNGNEGGGGNGGDNGNEGDDSGTNDETGEDQGPDTIVDTTTGPVKGHAWGENTNIISYMDVRYGTFNSPFEAPVSPTPSESVHEAKVHSKRCPQLQDGVYVGDSDCLTLSIFKPLDASNASVLVHIYDGNFTSGSANPAIYGPEYLVSKGIILVLPNYRLGPLGFLCLHNETAPGNGALKDLSLALSWVKENILKFGGNPENIAVSGDGTAGALAGYLALSPMSRRNVSKVITESGSVLSHWALDRNPIVPATNLVNNINGFSTWQNVELSVLVSAAEEVSFRPCLERNTDEETHFMVKTPWAMLEDEEIKIHFMLGSAKYAGVHEYLQLTEDSIQLLNDDVGRLLPNDLRFATNEERNIVGNRVKTQYFDDADINLANVDCLSLYFTDAGYLSPGIRTARTLADAGATVYFYEFSFVGDLNRELEAIDHPVEGAVRGDIIGYLFTQDGVVPSDDTKEKRMVEQLIELWTSFLKTGTPTAENIVWNKLETANASEEKWLSIGTVTSIAKGLHEERMSLWTDIYDKHFIERNLALDTSPSVYTVLLLQILFFMSFFRNTSHFL